MAVNMCEDKVEINFIKGSIFETERYGLDAIIVFIPCGLTSIRWDCYNFVKIFGEPIIQFKEFFLYQNKSNNKNQNLKYVLIDKNPSNIIYKPEDIPVMVAFALRLISKLGSSYIGMNGIRTSNHNSEWLLVREVKNWLNNNNHNFQHIYFIDKRDGFNKHV